MVSFGQVERLGTTIVKALEHGATRALDGKPIMSPIFKFKPEIAEAIPDHLFHADVFRGLATLEGQPLQTVERMLNEANPSNPRDFLSSLGISLDTGSQRMGKDLEQLWGTEKDLIFKQNNIGDCYLLASLYGMWRNPTGKKVLQNTIKTTLYGYQVKIGAHSNYPIIVRFSEITGQIADGIEKKPVDGCDALKIIERAYGKLRKILQGTTGASLKVVDAGHQQDCLLDLFGNIATPIRIASDTNGNAILSTNPNLTRTAEHLLEKFAKNPERYVLSASTPNIPEQENYWFQFSRNGKQCAQLVTNGHAYAIRDVDPLKRIINVVNPHDTSQISEYTYDEFFQVFRGIEGVKIDEAPIC